MSEYICHCLHRSEPGIEWHPTCFGQMWLFEGISSETWKLVAPALKRKYMKQGEDLFRQGDPANSMYMIKTGSVKLWKLSEDGRALTLDIWKTGDLVGESVLVDEDEYPVSATCLEPTKTCGIDRETFEMLVKKHHEFGLVTIRNLARRIQYLTGRLHNLSEPTLEERLHRVLTSVAKQVGNHVSGGWEIAFPLSHEEIGFLVGAHRVSVTRALKKLRDSGRIHNLGRNLFIAESY